MGVREGKNHLAILYATDGIYVFHSSYITSRAYHEKIRT